MQNQDLEYGGFWIRTGATFIDAVLLFIVITPFLAAIILFWVYKSATPGKMATNLTIVDAQTGAKPSVRQFVIRYLGYIVATVPLCLGLIWVGIDRRKQGWHDKLAGTVVVRKNKPEPVRFEGGH